MNYLEKFRRVKQFIFDIDGVLTNGQIMLDSQGNLLRSMNVRDGFAIRTATNHGYRIAIISGGTTPGTHLRLGSLGVYDIHLGVDDKMEAYEAFVNKYRLKEEHILYMGDDLPDYEVMARVGLSCCPSNAVDEVRDLSHYVSPLRGGEGCVRDVIEKVMKLKEEWPGYPGIKIKA